MKTACRFGVFAVAVALFGCDGTTVAESPDAAVATADDAGESVDAGEGVDAPADADATGVDAESVDAEEVVCGAPRDGYGTTEGSAFRPITLTRCDGTPYEFYGEAEGFCEAAFTVLSMGAGWCGPCRDEAPFLQQVATDYADRGVRVISVLTQDNDGNAATVEFCNGWVTQYSLELPTLIDPLDLTLAYFPAFAYPGLLIVDSRGTIVHRSYGASENLLSLRRALDEVLSDE